ncbi:MAG TPA: hypothetical protein VE523_08880 [Solirubrobacterales bacterium]|jgi:hypothetical protein|nr:hypothetical protein [Solirubrobacterales bacterium]
MRSERPDGSAGAGHQEILIGVVGPREGGELRRVAERDSGAVPTGCVLAGRVDGRLVAAISVTSGRMVADPFVHTAEIRELLSERAAQLRGEGLRGRRLGRLLRRRAHARAALPASPPGAGGKLLQI